MDIPGRSHAMQMGASGTRDMRSASLTMPPSAAMGGMSLSPDAQSWFPGSSPPMMRLSSSLSADAPVFLPIPSVVGRRFQVPHPCVVCDMEAVSWKRMDEHLRQEHSVVVEKADEMVFLSMPQYLNEWRQLLAEGAPLDERAEPNGDGMLVLGPALGADDDNVRSRVRKKTLQSLLRKQHQERTNPGYRRQCLFCKKTLDSVASLFRHMYVEHSFNCGHQDNLVNTSELLDHLQGKLARQQCIYCQKTFKSHATLKLHMRKKKHFKLPKNASEYDRFYLINYLEAGKKWMDMQNEADDDVAFHEEDEEWEDWSDDAAEQDNAMCLFCPHVDASVNACLKHMCTDHDFDLDKHRHTLGLDFYTTVRLVNYIRSRVAQHTCITCDKVCMGNAALLGHMESSNHHNLLVHDMKFWSDNRFLVPVLQDDALLHSGMAEEDEQFDANDADGDVEGVLGEDMPHVNDALTAQFKAVGLIHTPTKAGGGKKGKRGGNKKKKEEEKKKEEAEEKPAAQ